MNSNQSNQPIDGARKLLTRGGKNGGFRVRVMLAIFLVMVLHVISADASGAVKSSDARALADPIARVELLENHHEALAVWAKYGIRAATVVHVDSHHDMLTNKSRKAWGPLQRLVESQDGLALETLGNDLAAGKIFGLNNYLVPAWDLGIVNEIWWVYPHASAFDENFLKQLKQYLAMRQMQKFAPAEIEGWYLDGTSIRGTLRGIPVVLSRLEDLPEFKKPVLLDIDCDYFVGDAGLPAAFDLRAPLIQDRLLTFLGNLKQKRVPVQVATVVTSVNGDFLPLRFQYLGRILYEKLKEPRLSEDLDSTLWKTYWAAEKAYENKDAVTAMQGFETVSESDHWLSGYADYYRALISARLGDFPAAEELMQALVSSDQAFTWGLFDIGGIAKKSGKRTVAERLYSRSLALGKHWSFEGQLELGRLFAEEGYWEKAEKHFAAANKLYPGVDLARGLLAESLMHQFKFTQAYAIYRAVWEAQITDMEYYDGRYLPNLIKSALLAGDKPLAFKAFARLETVDPGNPELTALRLLLAQAGR